MGLLEIVLALLAACLLDLLIGDPRSRIHPVVMLGKLAAGLEGLARGLIWDASPKTMIAAGAVTALLSIAVSCLFASLLLFAFWQLHPCAAMIAAVVLIAFSIAPRSLAEHACRVYSALKKADLEQARYHAGQMVGRDTAGLEPAEIVRATVESVAENLVDAVIAPLFYAVLAWLTLFFLAIMLEYSWDYRFAEGIGALAAAIGAVLYRAVNTLDAMFGYRNQRYENFGRFSARLDDLLGWLPARISAILACLSAFILSERATAAFMIWLRDGNQNPSPNAGQSQAAFAGALGIQLGGTSIYREKILSKPLIGKGVESLQPLHILRAIRLMVTALLLLLLLLAVGTLLAKDPLLGCLHKML